MFTREPMPAPAQPPAFPHLLTDGLTQEIKTFRDGIRIPQHAPQYYAQDGRKPIRGGVLFGRPGNGKNTIAEALYQESYILPKFAYIQLMGDDIFLGDWKMNLAKVFSAGRVFSPSLVFIDEADALLKTKDDGSHTEIGREFLKLINCMLPTDVVVLVLATNLFKEQIDEALTREERLELVFELKDPTRQAREEIVRSVTKFGTPNALPGMTLALLRHVTGRMAGFSRAQVKAVCNVAKDAALERLNPAINANPPVYQNLDLNIGVLREDFTAAILTIKRR